MIIIFGFEFKDKYILYLMLTRKQMWKRQKSTFIEELLFKKELDGLYMYM